MNRRLFISLLYLLALMGGAGFIFSRFQGFSGQLYIPLGRAESMAVRAAGSKLALADAHAMPAELIAFDNPQEARRYFGDSESFDVMRLPFRIRLNQIEAIGHDGEESGRRYRLEVSATKRSFALAPGECILIEGWEVCAAPEFPPGAALLEIRRGIWGRRHVIGGLLFLMGAIGLVVLRFRRRS